MRFERPQSIEQPKHGAAKEGVELEPMHDIEPSVLEGLDVKEIDRLIKKEEDQLARIEERNASGEFFEGSFSQYLENANSNLEKLRAEKAKRVGASKKPDERLQRGTESTIPVIEGEVVEETETPNAGAEKRVRGGATEVTTENIENAEVDTDLEGIQAEAKRFEERMQEISRVLEKASDVDRQRMAGEYLRSLDNFARDTENEIRSLRGDLDTYVRYTKVGHFIDNFSASFNTKREKETLADTINHLREEKIPPTNIPAILGIIKQLGLLNHKLSLIRETKVLVSGYEATSEKETKKAWAKIAKKELSGLVEAMDASKEGGLYQLDKIGKLISEIGIDMTYLSKARELIVASKRLEAKEELLKLDAKLNEIIK